MKQTTTTPTPLTTTKHITQSNNVLEDQIRLRAYEIYERRGREDGHEVEDWYQAEAELTQQNTVTLAA